MKKPDKTSVSWPSELTPLIRQRMVDEHYPTVPKYFLGCILHDLIARRKHLITSPLVTGPEFEMEKGVVEISRDFYSHPRKDGKWLREKIEGIMEDRRAERRRGKK